MFGNRSRTAAIRFAAVLLILVFAAEFIMAAPAQALSYSSRDAVPKYAANLSEVNSGNSEENYPQNNEEFTPAEEAGDSMREEVLMPAKDIIVYLEPGIMGALSVSGDSADEQGGMLENVVLMAPQPGETIEQAVERLQSSPGVAYAEPNYLFYAQFNPESDLNDPLFGDQWALNEIEAVSAWSNVHEFTWNREIPPLTVAVIDTGVDYDHEDLAGRVLDQGYNARTNTYGKEAAQDDSTSGHGTHIAGIIAAASSNETGIAGITWTLPVYILPVKVLDSKGIGTMLDVANGIRYAADQGAKVINLSFGARLPDYPRTLADAIIYAQSKGAVVVAAAGNDGGSVKGFYPACLPDVLTVAATGMDHKVLSFSNYDEAEINAPGFEILSTLPGDDYGYLTGTSQAAAFVSGVAAILYCLLPHESPLYVNAAISEGMMDYDGHKVLNASNVVAGSYWFDLSDEIKIISPENGSYVSGVVDVVAVIEKPKDVVQVNFAVTNTSTGEIKEYTLQGSSDVSVYTFSWDTTREADAAYIIEVEALDEYEWSFSYDIIYCTVANNQQDGLIIAVKKPGDGSEPAEGALVTVHHAYYDEREGYTVYEELWEGYADGNGMAIIPGTVATGGNDFFITARGSEPAFVYYTIARAPAMVVIDSSNAHVTEIEAKDLNGVPLAGARVLVEMLEANIPGLPNSDEVIDFGYYHSELNHLIVDNLDSEGKANIFLTKGKYNIRVIKPPVETAPGNYAPGYYLFNYGVDVDENSETVSFAPQEEDLSVLNFQPDPDAVRAELVIECLDPYFGGFDLLRGGETIYVTPGEYRAYGTLTYLESEGYDDYEYNVQFETEITELVPKSTRTIQAGGASASLHVVPHVYGNQVFFDINLEDYYGNRLTDINIKSASGDEDNVLGGIVITDSNGNLVYRGDNVDYFGHSWTITEDISGEFTATITFETPMFGEVTESVDFEIQPGTGGPVKYMDLYVTVLDRNGDPMPGAKVVPVVFDGSSESRSINNNDPYDRYNVYTTDENGQTGLMLEHINWDKVGLNHGIMILGESADPDKPESSPEPLFIYVPLNVERLPMEVTVDTSDYLMKRVVFESYDQNGNPLSIPHYNAIYFDTGDGILAGLVLDKQNSGERVLWLPNGDYEYQTFVNSTLEEYFWDPSYFMTESFEIDASSPSEQTITLGGEDLALFEGFGSDTFESYMEAVALYNGENRQSPVFFRGLDADTSHKIYVTPGIYNVQGVITYVNEKGEVWKLWIEKEVSLEAGEFTGWEYGGAISAQIAIDNPYPNALDTVKFTSSITDGYGNRAIAANADRMVFFDSASQAEGEDVSAQHHYEIAPFITIRNGQGDEVYRYKDAGSNYDLLLLWNSWSPELYGTVKPINRESTYSGMEYTIPVDLPGGEYTAVLELDLGFAGTFGDEVTFNVDAGLLPPQLDSLQQTVTNAGSVTVTGSASPNATVKLFYRLNGGERTEAVTVQAGADGKFTAVVGLPSEGTYLITAVVVEDDASSGESNSCTVTVDRTPPGQPLNLRGESPDQSHVNLSWDVPSDNDILKYEIYRDGAKTGEVPAGSLSYQDSGLEADTEYSYEVVAVDEAGNRSNASVITVRTSTGADTLPPEVPSNLLAVYDPSSASIAVTWNAARDNVGTVGYEVYRSLDGSSWELLASVDASPNPSYTDIGPLSAETTYRYSVLAYDEAGNKSERSGPVEVTTPSLSLDSVRLRVRKDMNGMVAVGDEITMTAYGDRNRKVYVEFELECWEGDQPESTVDRIQRVELEEVKDPQGKGTGVYQGTYTVQEDTAVVKAARAFISDEAIPEPHLEFAEIAGLPLNVSGTLRVTIAEASQEALGAIRLGKLQLWSDLKKWGAYESVDDPKTYTYSGLIPSNDYSLKLTRIDNKVVKAQEGIAVLGGRTTTVTIVPPEPSTLFVRLIDSEKNPIKGRYVSIANDDPSYTLFWSQTNEDGWATADKSSTGKQPALTNRFDIDKVAIYSYELDMEPVFYPSTRKVVELQPGENVIEIELQKRPMGTLRGQIIGYARLPLVGASVRIIQEVEGEKVTRETKTDVNGNYSIELNAGPAEVAIYHGVGTRNRYLYYDVIIENGKTETLDVNLESDGLVIINAYSQKAGEPEFPLGMNTWRVSALYKVYIKKKETPNQIVLYTNCDDIINGFVIRDVSPGEEYEITLDGSYYGYGKDSGTVTLNENRFAEIELHLREEGLIKADVRDQQGRKNTGLTRSVYVYGGNTPDARLVEKINTGDNAISLHLDEGRYTAVFCWGLGYRDVTITGGAQRPNNDHILTLGSMEEYLNSVSGAGYIKVENINVAFNQVTDLGRITVPYGTGINRAFNNEDSGITANRTTAGPGSVITLRAQYRLSEGFGTQDILNPRLRLSIPDGTTLIENSVIVETENGFIPGNIDTSHDWYIEVDLNDGTGKLCSNKGSISYQVRVDRRPDWPITSASASMYYMGRDFTGALVPMTDEIGEVYIDIPYVTLSVPEIVTAPVVNISGYAPPDTSVRIYDGSILLAETSVSQYGTWIKNVELADRGDPSKHWIYARVIDQNGDELALGQVLVIYDTSYPVIKMITMGQERDGHVVSYNPSESAATFPYVYVPTYKTYLKIEFENIQRVDPDSVTIYAESSGIYIKAEYMESENSFYAIGYLAGTSYNSWLPGPISIEYEVLPRGWTVPTDEPSVEELKNELPGVFLEAEFDTSGDTGDYGPDDEGYYRSPTVIVRTSPSSGADFELQGWITVRFLDNYPPVQGPGASPAISIGRSASGGSMDVYNFNYSITTDSNGDGIITGSFTVPIEAVDPDYMSQMGIQALPPGLRKGLETSFTIIDKSNDFVSNATKFLTQPSMFDELMGLLDLVDQNCNGYASNMYYDLINIEAEAMWKDFTVKSAMQVVGAAATGTGFGASVGIPVFILGGLFEFIVDINREKSIEDLRNKIMNDRNCKDEEDDDEDNDDDNDDDEEDNPNKRKNKKQKQKVSDHDYVLDPSGYVYEAVPDNRLQGVTTTLFKKNADTGAWEFWDAEWYWQNNPLITDAQGRYAWDVPVGFWQVLYEKEGYETAASQVLEVPPPHTDVNVGLVSLAAPTVLSATASGGGEYVEVVFDRYMRTATIAGTTLRVQKAGQTDEDGNPIYTEGNVIPVNPQDSPDTGESLARVFRFEPKANLEVNGEYIIWVSGMVQSYAGSIMGADYTGTLVVPEKTIPVQGVTINRSSLTLYPGENSQLTAAVTPADATNKTVSWSTSNPGVATVSSNGLVTAKAVGTAVITVTTVDGGHTDSCTVTVVARTGGGNQQPGGGNGPATVAVKGITLDRTELTLTLGGEPVVLNARIIPDNATNKSVIWSSSNPAVAVVQDGKVTPVGAGTTVITVKTVDGGYTATCKVTVKAASADGVFRGSAGVNAASIGAFNGGITLVLETATFLLDTEVTIERFEAEGRLEDYVYGSPVFDISFGGKEPAKPITVIIKLDDGAAGETNPLKFALYRWDEESSAWKYAAGAVNTEDSTVTGSIEESGRYMLMAYDRTFSDVTGHWSREYVEILAGRHVVNGYENNIFKPKNQVTRAEFIKMVMSMVPNCPYVKAARTKETGSYGDVAVGKWYFPYIEAATELGLVSGSNGLFRPEDPITREEMAVILMRIFNRPNEMEQAAKEYPALFKDAEEISGWALGAIVLANQKGIIKGDGDGRFRPKDKAERAEAAAMILRTMECLGFIKTPLTLKGTLRVVEIEGSHFELEVSSGISSEKVNYVIVPADFIIENQLKPFIDREVQVTGILQEEVSIFMRGPVLKAMSIGDRIRTACAKCSQ